MTDKELLFLEAYLGVAHFNATEAARIAGYKDPEYEGWRVRQREDVQAAVAERVSLYAMSAEEVLSELSKIGRIDAGEIITVPPVGMAYFDFRKAEKAGKLGLIKKLSYTEHGPSVELFDKQAALVQLGKFHKLWVDKVETALEGDLVVRVEYAEEDPNAGSDNGGDEASDDDEADASATTTDAGEQPEQP